MKIFIASSRESLGLVREIEVWLEEKGHEPVPWDKPGLFVPGAQTFQTLIDISRTVEAAVFVFSADDRAWYRGDSVALPRDNVLIEYGLFAGALDPRRAIICRDGSPKHPVDLAGLTYIDLSVTRRSRGKLELSIWAGRLTSGPIDPAVIRLHAKVAALELERESLRERLTFESEKSRDLEGLLGRSQFLDFSTYDLTSDGHWKLLFDFEYFHAVAAALAKSVENPMELRGLLFRCGAGPLAIQLAWHSPGTSEYPIPDRGETRTIFLSRKMLRRFRDTPSNDLYRDFLIALPQDLRHAIDDEGRRAIERRTRGTFQEDPRTSVA